MRRNFAQQVLARFIEAFNNDPSINFFLERQSDLHRTLDIFVRTNSGGTRLSYSDLLLSMITASWNGKDARQEILQFVDMLNDINEDLSVDKDLVMKACLVLADVKDIKFNVENLTASNLATIQAQWGNIKIALHLAVSLAAKFGFTNRSLLSENALIPIAYHLKKQISRHPFSKQTHPVKNG